MADVHNEDMILSGEYVLVFNCIMYLKSQVKECRDDQ